MPICVDCKKNKKNVTFIFDNFYCKDCDAKLFENIDKKTKIVKSNRIDDML